MKENQYEFCLAKDCPELRNDETGYHSCNIEGNCCKFTAKDFYKWLKKNGFEISM